jgi:hypothetical protein
MKLKCERRIKRDTTTESKGKQSECGGRHTKKERDCGHNKKAKEQ